MKPPCASYSASTGQKCKKTAADGKIYCSSHLNGNHYTEQEAKVRAAETGKFKVESGRRNGFDPDFLQKYYASTAWAKKKQEWTESATRDPKSVGGWDGCTYSNRREKITDCWGCGSPPPVQFHHRTYDRLGDEDLRDLIPLCDKCHKFLHQVKKHHSWDLESAYRALVYFRQAEAEASDSFAAAKPTEEERKELAKKFYERGWRAASDEFSRAVSTAFASLCWGKPVWPSEDDEEAARLLAD